MQNTTNYNLNKPDGNDFAKIASLNENADIIDAKLKELEDSESAFVQHANDQQIHVTQAKQEYWNGFLLRNGGVLNGQVNYNSLNTNCIYQVATIDGATGAPPESYGTLVYFHVPNTDYGYQEFTSVINQTRYLRITSSGTWQPWIKILNQNDYDTLFQSVSSGKTAIANAITQKGVATSATAEFATMATNILSINTGKKFATGVGAGATTMYSFRRAFNDETVSSYGLTVSGLDFKPRLILAFDAVSISMYQNYLNLDSTQTGGVATDFTTITAFGGGTQTAVNTLHGTGGDGYVNNGGFRIPIRSNTITVNWIAIE